MQAPSAQRKYRGPLLWPEFDVHTKLWVLSLTVLQSLLKTCTMATSETPHVSRWKAKHMIADDEQQNSFTIYFYV